MVEGSVLWGKTTYFKGYPGKKKKKNVLKRSPVRLKHEKTPYFHISDIFSARQVKNTRIRMHYGGLLKVSGPI